MSFKVPEDLLGLQKSKGSRFLTFSDFMSPEEIQEMERRRKVRKPLSQDPETLDRIVQDEAKRLGLPNWRSARSTEEIWRECVRFEEELVPAREWNETGHYFGRDSSISDIISQGSYIPFMTLRGEREGIWDGIWDDHFHWSYKLQTTDPEIRKNLTRFLKQRLRHFSTSYRSGTLDRLIIEAATSTRKKEQ